MDSWDPDTQDPPLEFYAIQERLAPVVAEIKRVATTDTSFCFVANDAADSRVVVCRTNDISLVSEDDYRAVVPEWAGIAFSHAVVNRAQILELVTLTRSSEHWLEQRGIHIEGYGGPSVEDDAEGLAAGGHFEILYSGDGEPDAEVLLRFGQFGAKAVRFERGHISNLM